MKQPNHVEAVVARVDGRLWKFARYSDDVGGKAPDEHELYDLEADPMEATNLANANFASAPTARVRKQMDEVLREERRAKRLTAPN